VCLPRNRTWGCGLDSSGSGQGPVAGCYEHSNASMGSMKGILFLE